MLRTPVAVKAILLLLPMFSASHPACAQRPRGTVATTTLTSPALEGNVLGDPATRQAKVYLPPSYDVSTKRYPVAYYLHGALGDENAFFAVSGRSSADGLISDGMMEEMIIVGVDGSGGQPITGFLNSELNGNYEDYVVRDLVHHIDSTFRTIPSRNSRAVFGASMGGYATLRHAMAHPDVFGAAYMTSTGLVDFSRPGAYLYLGGEVAVFSDQPNAGADLDRVERPSHISGQLRGLSFGWASIFSPNLEKPPLFVDLPFELPSLEIISDVRDKWFEHDSFVLLEDHVSDLSSLRGLAFDVGNLDGNLTENEAFHQALLDAGVPHQFEVFAGDHRDKRAQRIGVALAFLSNTLLHPDCNADGSVDVNDLNCATGDVDLASSILTQIGSIAGDADGNGGVDVADFTVLANNFGQPGKYTDGDFDWDGQVNFADFLILSHNFGKTSATFVTPVPEPTSAGFVMAIFLTIATHLCRAPDRTNFSMNGLVRILEFEGAESSR